jgi:xanthine dehydrogenase YagR molybdenum-binding subunit
MTLEESNSLAQDADKKAGALAWQPRKDMHLINQWVPRVDGPAKVSGRATYTHDIRLPGMVYARVLRCAHPAAKVTLDLEPAKKIPGVLAAISLVDATNWLGRPIAAVAATTPEIAEDGIRAIVAKYEAQPFAVSPEQALAENAPKVGSSGNVMKDDKRDTRAEGVENLAQAEDLLKTCAAKVEGKWSVPVQHHASLETHGVVVDYRGNEEATVYCSTQGTFTIPGDAADKLGLKAKQVTGIVDFMGGGFGSKFGLGLEGATACQLAKELKRPVHLMFTRSDEFHAAGNRSGGIHELRGGANKDGELVVLIGNVSRLGGVGRGAGQPQPYMYKPRASYVESRSVLTNTDSSRAMRAPGHPQASFPMESLMDDLAYAIGMDPVEFRKRNLDSGKRDVFSRHLDRVAEAIGWKDHPHKTSPDTSNAEKKIGIGFGIGAWGSGGDKSCKVEVRIAADGSVEVLSGTQDLGTGTRTYVATIVADELGVPLGQVTAKIGNSNYGNANASGGSATTAALCPAVKDAAVNARQALAEKVAKSLGCDAAAITFAGGKLSDSGNAAHSMAWKDACASLGPNGLSAQGGWQDGLSGGQTHTAQAAKVEVDTLTGEIKVLAMVAMMDCGLVLNRAASVSQLNGGMVQALSYGLLEQRVIDPELGLILNANFEDYKIAGCQEIPAMTSLFDDTDERGPMGMAEPAVIPGHSAIANAIYNACGVRLRELPMTCDKLLMGLIALKKA